MHLLRRLAAPLAFLLALVVAGEVTDLVPCIGADCGVWSLVLGGGAHGGDTAPAGSPDAACLCHARFVPAAAVPRAPVLEAVSQGPSSPVVVGWPCADAADVPHPPPLG